MAKDEEYEIAVKKGSQLLGMLNASKNATAKKQTLPSKETQSTFTAVEDLSKHGYTDELTAWKSSTTILKRLASALQDLGVSTEMVIDGGNNMLVENQHLEDRIIDGIVYPATLATFVQICNPIDGVLIAYNNTTAPHSGRLLEPPVLNFPPLHHWSDFAYLQWLCASSNPPSPASVADSASTPAVIIPAPIKYIFRLSIQNVTTYSILNKIMAKYNRTTYEVWPGMTFPIDSEEGKAILGTPNGAGVAWLLTQHKQGLENRVIENVTVFYATNNTDLYRWPSLCFHISS